MQRTEVRTREEVAALLAEGKSVAAIARALGLTKAAICYHRRRLGHPVDVRCNRRYDWPEVQRYYDSGRSVRECRSHFGFTSKTWHDAVKRGAIAPRPVAAPIEVYLVAGRRTNRSHLKARLLSEGLKQNRCEECGLSEWRGRPLCVALHHINGDRADNRLENIAFLCPNCHSQTPNFSGRNLRKAPKPTALRRAA